MELVTENELVKIIKIKKESVRLFDKEINLLKKRIKTLENSREKILGEAIQREEDLELGNYIRR